MNTKHTEGKWEATNTCVSIDTRTGLNKTANIVVDNVIIAQTWSVSIREAEANAKLIAFAPELLYRLIIAVEQLEMTLSSDNLELLAMKKAIKKATE